MPPCCRCRRYADYAMLRHCYAASARRRRHILPALRCRFCYDMLFAAIFAMLFSLDVSPCRLRHAIRFFFFDAATPYATPIFSRRVTTHTCQILLDAATPPHAAARYAMLFDVFHAATLIRQKYCRLRAIFRHAADAMILRRLIRAFC